MGLGALIEGDLEGQPAPGDAEPAEDGLLQDHQGQQQPELFHQGDQQGAGGIYEAEQGEHGQAQGDGQEAKKPEVSQAVEPSPGVGAEIGLGDAGAGMEQATEEVGQGQHQDDETEALQAEAETGVGVLEQQGDDEGQGHQGGRRPGHGAPNQGQGGAGPAKVPVGHPTGQTEQLQEV